MVTSHLMLLGFQIKFPSQMCIMQRVIMFVVFSMDFFMLLNNWRFKYFLDIRVLVENLALPTLFLMMYMNQIAWMNKESFFMFLNCILFHLKSLT
jgi:hypothetical protein